MTNDVVIAQSKIEGLGVFAQRRFTPGERVLSIDDSRIVDANHPLQPGEEQRHCDYLARGRVVLMQSPERHINHSCDPNAYVKTIDGKRCVIARRAIACGEEITYDYCINSDGNVVWNCHCGAERCRQEIHSDFFHLPLQLQKEYLPLLDEWFRREYRDKVVQLQRIVTMEFP